MKPVARQPVDGMATTFELPSRSTSVSEERTSRRSRERAYATLPWIIGICAVAVTVRVWGIDQFGLNSDEAVYVGQGAAIAKIPILTDMFPVFRAHPLLFQFLVAIFLRWEVSDLTPRLLSVAFGVGTVVVTFALGSLLYSRRVGLLAGTLLAVMPYHAIVSRQALLDGPMTFFATLSLYLIARYALAHRPAALYAAAAAMGLTVLTKETGILFVGALYAFFALNSEVRIGGLRRGLVALGIVAVVILPFPLSLVLGGGSETGKSYLTWQLFRESNHDWPFYLQVVPIALGPLALGSASLSLWSLRKRWTWRETLLVCWIAAPLVFFQLWPVKGYQYPLPIAIPVTVLAARLLNSLITSADRVPGKVLSVLASVLVAGSLLVSSIVQLSTASTGRLLAGTGGVPGGREMGTWIKSNTPVGARVLTIGPSMANLVQFYGHREARGLAVSPNPLHRNPSYEPVRNPDFSIRNNDLQYLVWDAYSASRSRFFSDKLLRYVDIYNGRVVYSYSLPIRSAEGRVVRQPVILLFEVRPRT